MMRAILAMRIQTKYILLMAAFLGICFSTLSVFKPSPVHAQSPTQTAASCKQDFFGLEPWYQYIGVELTPNGTTPSSASPYGSCEFKCFNIFDTGSNVGQPPNNCGQVKSDIPLILLAVIDDLLRVAALTAVAFVIYGAFEYVGSQGNSEVTARAQSMVVNALIGLTISTIAVVVVNFIGNNLGT
jgi:hypothetical protein